VLGDAPMMVASAGSRRLKARPPGSCKAVDKGTPQGRMAAFAALSLFLQGFRVAVMIQV